MALTNKEMIKNVIDENELILRSFTVNRRSGYTTLMKNLVENSENSLLICEIGDKQHIAPRNNKILSISTLDNAIRGKSNTNIILDNHYIMELCRRNIDIIKSLSEDVEHTHESVPKGLNDYTISEFYKLQKTYDDTLSELIKTKELLRSIVEI